MSRRTRITGSRGGRWVARVGVALVIFTLALAGASGTPAASVSPVPSTPPIATTAPGASREPSPGVLPSPALEPSALPAVGARPLVFAYYYIWYSTTSWRRAKIDLPQLGSYDSGNRAVIAQHLAWARAAGIDGLIVSWKHEPRLDQALQILVDESAKVGMKLILLYQGLDFDRQPLADSTVAGDLTWFLDTYAGAAPFDVFGRPTIVWSGTWGYKDSQLERVRAAIGAPGRALLLGSERSAAAYTQRAAYFDGDAYYWSSPDPLSTPRYQRRLDELAAAVRIDAGRWIAPAAPGFDARLIGGTSIVPRRDGATFQAAWAGALQTNPDVLGIISWNEFSENSQIEPSKTYGTTYLDLAGRLVAGLPPIVSPPGSSDLTPIPSSPASASTGTGTIATEPPARIVETNNAGVAAGAVLVIGMIALGWALRRRSG